MFTYGTKLIGLKRPAPEHLTLQTGKNVQIDLECSQGIVNPERVGNHIMSKLGERYPEIQVVWMRVCEKFQTISLQFTVVPLETMGYTPRTQPLFIGGLLAWLPAILALIGIGTIAVTAWDIIAGIPWYAWALLGTGVALLLFGPAIASLLQRRTPPSAQPTFILPRVYRNAY